MLFNTPQDKLKYLVAQLQDEGYNILLQNDRGDGKRAQLNTKKRDVGLEFLVIRNEVLIGLKLYKDFEYKKELLQHIESNGYMVPSKYVKQQNVRFLSDDHINDFKGILELIENADFLDDVTGASWKSTAEKDVRIANIVKIIRIAATTSDTTLLNREMVDALTPKVSVNEKTEENNYGEHVVPIDFMFKHSVNLINDGATDDQVIDFWNRNLKVAYITEAQAYEIDVTHGMRTVMTEGWKDGDSPFARLEAINIVNNDK